MRDHCAYQRVYLLAAFLATTITLGCTGPRPASYESPQLSRRLAFKRDLTNTATRDFAAAVADRKDIAFVNGQSIASQDFLSTLIEARGLALLQQLLFLEAVKGAAEKESINLTPALVEREYDLTLAEAADGNEKKLTPKEREALIDSWCDRRGIPRTELRIAMQRQALLRQMAKRKIRVTGALVEEEFNRINGAKVEVRHLQLPSRRSYARIKSRLGRDEPFINLVHEYSINAISKASGGLLPPFTRNDRTVPERFAEVAFALKPGEISPLFEAEGSYHLIKLERKIEATGGALGDGRQDIERRLQRRLVTAEMEKLGRQILDAAKIEIEQEDLRRQYIRDQKAGRFEGPKLQG